MCVVCVLCCFVLSCVVLCCLVLSCVVLCCVVVCCVVWCCVVCVCVSVCVSVKVARDVPQEPGRGQGASSQSAAGPVAWLDST